MRRSSVGCSEAQRVQRSSAGCGAARSGCGVRYLPMEVVSTALTGEEEIEKQLGEWRRMNA
jgi:hypothetical protein